MLRPWNFRRVVLLLLALLPLSLGEAFVTGTAILPVADDGTLYDRDTWNPTNGSFPGVNATYTDPVFGEVIKRLTAIYPDGGGGLSTHNQWNADGTKLFWQHASLEHVLNTSGTQVETNIPGGFGTEENHMWSPFNADLYYYTTGDSLWQRNIATDTTSLVKDFNVTLLSVGTKGLWLTHAVDDIANPTNLLFVINTAASGLQIWDQTRDVLLSGSMDFTITRWAALSPDGRWLIRATTGDSASMYALPVNALTSTLGAGSSAQAGVNVWDDVCFDHGAIVSLTTGKTYLITGACNLNRWHYRVDVTLNQAGRTTAQQTADALALFQTDGTGVAGNLHYSCAQYGGAMQNWCWAAIDDTGETSAAPGTWYAHKQEIVAVNMQTGTTYRMAHHRSYPQSGNFCGAARVNVSQDGMQAFFMSGMGLVDAEAGCGYSDVYHLSGRHLAAEKPWSRRPIFQTQ